MKNYELHRGRLLDHIGLVVKDLAASKRFYTTAMDALGIPLDGETPEDFWFDELFVSSQGSKEAQGKLTGRVHLAFQAPDRATRATTRLSFSTPTATTSKRSITARRSARPAR